MAKALTHVGTGIEYITALIGVIPGTALTALLIPNITVTLSEKNHSI